MPDETQPSQDDDEDPTPRGTLGVVMRFLVALYFSWKVFLFWGVYWFTSSVLAPEIGSDKGYWISTIFFWIAAIATCAQAMVIGSSQVSRTLLLFLIASSGATFAFTDFTNLGYVLAAAGIVGFWADAIDNSESPRIVKWKQRIWERNPWLRKFAEKDHRDLN